MESTVILLLGMNCKIVFAMENLKFKNKSGLFDWVESKKFDDILYCIDKLSKEEDLSITYERPGFPGNIFIDDTEIRTSHYTYEEYKEILKRRSERFLETIKSNNSILFIREDLTFYGQFTTKENIIHFKELIYKINPDCNYNFLLLSPPEYFTKIEIDNVFCEINDESKYESIINKICKENPPMKTNNSVRMEKDF
jgi:hypothetical protein